VKAIAAGIGLALALGSADGSAKSMEVARNRRAAESGKDTVIGIGARWDKACRSTGVPQVWLDEPPAHGFVCIRAGLVRPRNLLFGNAGQCLMKDIDGVQVVYRSQAGFAGSEALRYTLKFQRGAQPVMVDIRVTPAAGGPRNGREAPFERQPPGEMPGCAALVS
jgi:hypothetical protein